LKANLARVLRRVGEGERVRITRRGQPVAELVPAMPRSEAMKKLIAEGRVTPASRPPSEAPPATPIDTGTSASELILAEREEER
jgi:prevent-host-death family protein